LLRLEGPLQSWGSRSRWDVRDTQPEPTKSGVIGLLGCALGYPVGDLRLEQHLDAGLRFGVRVEEPGRAIQDYQTITGFLPAADGGYKRAGQTNTSSMEHIRKTADAKPATIISPRAYLEDAGFLVALEETGAAPGVLTDCAAALQCPAWPYYLGRKACIPTRPMFEALTEDYAGIEDALRRHPWSWLGVCLHPRAGMPQAVEAYVEDESGPLVRQDAVLTNVARQYGFRRARRIEVRPAPAQGDAP
jgi:CRISPR system Cascade subunit CasD